MLFWCLVMISKGGRGEVSRGRCQVNPLLVKAFLPQLLRGHLLQGCPLPSGLPTATESPLDQAWMPPGVAAFSGL